MAANSVGPRPDAEGDGGEYVEPGDSVETPELPEDLTVPETIDWVSGDKARAQVALDAENDREKPRAGVVDGLQTLVSDED